MLILLLVNRDEILNILGKMKIKNIKYIALKRAEGYTYEKIGNKIGVSKETIRARLNKAKKELIELGITA
jgi:DNA-directed RNA polymerase specialized sigma24 family protein|nr:MAG TPA: Sigma factor AlgU negative regulatory factor, TRANSCRIPTION.96A [Caudoviricetes sp.]